MPTRIVLGVALALAASAALGQAAEEGAPGADDAAQERADSSAAAHASTTESEPPAADSAAGDDAGTGGVKAMAGMSVLGNQEAPTSLVIVPWKSSELGAGIGLSRALDTAIRPVDKDVFARELRYHAIRKGESP